MSVVLCCVVLSVVSGQEKLENVFFLLLAICVCSSVFCSPPHLPFSYNASTSHHLGARFRSVSLGSAYFHSISVRRHVAGHSRVKWIRCACFFLHSQLPPHFIAPHFSPWQLIGIPFCTNNRLLFCFCSVLFVVCVVVARWRLNS